MYENAGKGITECSLKHALKGPNHSICVNGAPLRADCGTRFHSLRAQRHTVLTAAALPVRSHRHRGREHRPCRNAAHGVGKPRPDMGAWHGEVGFRI